MRVGAAQVVDERIGQAVDGCARIERRQHAGLHVRRQARLGELAVHDRKVFIELLDALGIVLDQVGEDADGNGQAHGVLQVVGGFAAMVARTGEGGMTADLHRWLRRYFAASTFTRAFGASPNISGAYIASTRLGGSAKSPTLFRRTVYSIFTTPLGRYS